MAKKGEKTPCGAMFDLLKRHGVSHREFAGIVLSSKPISNGRSPVELAADRAWLSRFVVRAPVVSVQDRYFADYGTAAVRSMARLKSARGSALSDSELIELVCGEEGLDMARALDACGQDVTLYRNALERLARVEGRSAGERAEAAWVLFIAAGCSANVGKAVEYACGYVASVHGKAAATTPPAAAARRLAGMSEPLDDIVELGLIRIVDGYAVGNPYWVEPVGEGVVLGALAVGPGTVTDVGPDVSGEHARVRREGGAWVVEDLRSTNGTRVVSGADGSVREVAPGALAEILPGDELVLGESTRFVAIAGLPERRWGR